MNPGQPPAPHVTLQAVSLQRHGGLLDEWLGLAHVARWWGDPAARRSELRALPNERHAIIAVDHKPVGYLRWQTVDLAALAALGLSDVPAEAVDIDIFIGDPDWLERGIGPIALRLLLHERLHDAPLAGVCTSLGNARAIRAFEKAGFRKLRTFDDPDYGPCWVLTAQP